MFWWIWASFFVAVAIVSYCMLLICENPKYKTNKKIFLTLRVNEFLTSLLFFTLAIYLFFSYGYSWWIFLPIIWSTAYLIDTIDGKGILEEMACQSCPGYNYNY